MAISASYSIIGPGSVYRTLRWDKTGDAAGQTGQAGQAQPAAAFSATQASNAVNPAQYSLLGVLASLAGGAQVESGAAAVQGSGPPPPIQGGRAEAFASGLANLLQSVQSGDMATAQSAATALQGLMGGASAGTQTSATDATQGGQPPFAPDLAASPEAVQAGSAYAGITNQAAAASQAMMQPAAYGNLGNVPSGIVAAYMEWSF